MGVASTNDWDVVYATTFEEVNKGIARRDSSPKSCTQTLTEEGETFSLSASFGHWKLDPTRGDGSEVHLNIPIPTLSFTVADTDGSNPETKTFEKLVLRIAIHLQYLHESGTDTHHLKPHKVATNPEIEDADGKPISPRYRGYLQSLFDVWFNSHLNEFDHTFASIDLIEEADTGSFAFMRPTVTEYGVLALNDSQSSVFAVLTMCNSGRPTPKARQVSPYALTEGHNSALLIDKYVFMKDMLQPSLANMFMFANESDFSLSDSGHQISNNKRIKLNPMELTNGAKVEPYIDKERFNIRFEEDRLWLEFIDMNWLDPTTIHISVHLNYSASAYLHLSEDGKHLAFRQQYLQNSASTVEDSTGVATRIAFTILLSMAGAAIGASIGGAIAQAAAGGAEAAAEAGATIAAEDAAEGLASGASVVIEDLSETAALLGTDMAETEAETASTAATQVLNFAQKMATRIPNYFATNWPKILGSVVGAGIGGVAGNYTKWSELIDLSVTDGDHMLGQFAENALAPITWPDAERYELKDASINGALILTGIHHFKETTS